MNGKSFRTGSCPAFREDFFGRTLESALGFLMEDVNEGTETVHASIGIE